jgi:hypothetical protein
MPNQYIFPETSAMKTANIFFGKTFTAIITQGIPVGGKDIRKYLEGMGENFGFFVTKGCCLWTMASIPEQRQKKYYRR